MKVPKTCTSNVLARLVTELMGATLTPETTGRRKRRSHL